MIKVISAKGKIRTSAELLANLMTVIKETSANCLSEPQHQNYHEPIIIDQDKLRAEKRVWYHKEREIQQIRSLWWPKRKKMRKLLTLQWFHAKMIYPES